ncbi:MAG: hypothetical protein AB8H80_02650 [Planctomycetota bacterium]
MESILRHALTRRLGAAMLATAAASFAADNAGAQMELRRFVAYDTSEFARQQPAVGSQAPELLLHDLEGRPRSLTVEADRFIVLIAGSYT